MGAGNTLYFGDNLDILREYIADESVDLIYLDPPFNSQAQYNVLFKSPSEDVVSAQAEAFRDTWTWGEEAEWAFGETMKYGGSVARFIDALRSALGNSDVMAYLAMMTVRLHELRAKLKPTGALYLHCDPSASHYLKIILDAIFQPKNFRNEVIWKRTFAHGSAARWGDIHDSILFYSASDKYRWDKGVKQAHDPLYLEKKYRYEDDRGRYRYVVLTGPGVRSGDSGKPWMGYDPTSASRHWTVPRAPLEAMREEGVVIPDGVHAQLDLLFKNGFIRFSAARDGSSGSPEYKRHLTEGQSLQDIILDIPPVNSQADERIGYPTQKPVALLERIIQVSSEPGDIILDPFCGCGTTIAAAEKSGRQWIGIDIAIHAIKVIEARLANSPETVRYKLEGIPRDYLSACRLAKKDKYQFQWWANYLFNPHALRDQKKGADHGIDGELFFPNGPGRPWGRMLTSVKGGDSVGPSMVRDFRGVLDREKAEMGLFICLHAPTKAMMAEAASAGLARTVHDGLPKLQIVAIEEWFQGKFPKLPPLEHLPTAVFASAKRRRPAKSKRPDPDQPEFRYTFAGDREDRSTIHINPVMVGDASRRRAS